MKSVTRYDLQGGGEVVVSDSGEFVDYDDYQKLVAENAELKHAILEAQGGIELASAAINDDKRGDTFRDILNAIYMKISAVTPDTESAITEDLDSFDDDADAALNDWLNIKP